MLVDGKESSIINRELYEVATLLLTPEGGPKEEKLSTPKKIKYLVGLMPKETIKT